MTRPLRTNSRLSTYFQDLLFFVCFAADHGDLKALLESYERTKPDDTSLNRISHLVYENVRLLKGTLMLMWDVILWSFLSPPGYEGRKR